MGSKICVCMMGEDDIEENEDDRVGSSDDNGRGHSKQVVTTQTTAGSHCIDEIARSDRFTLNTYQYVEERCREEDTMYTVSLASPVAPKKEWYTPALKLLDYIFT